MANADGGLVLYVVGCGGYAARGLGQFVGFARGEGWDVCVIVTPDGAKFADLAGLAELTGHPVRSQYKQPDDPDVLPQPDAFVVAPATFNTINKWASGISDTLALGLLNEALGAGVPILAAPWPGAGLMAHPAFGRSLRDLREWGVRIIHDQDRPAQPGGSGAFPWSQLRAGLAGLRAAAQARSKAGIPGQSFNESED
jgi:phosphopantothenoylcysteine synthetase/decarboxylase